MKVFLRTLKSTTLEAHLRPLESMKKKTLEKKIVSMHACIITHRRRTITQLSAWEN